MAGTFGIIFSIGASLGKSVASAFSSIEKKLNATRNSLNAANRQAKAFDDVFAKMAKRDQLRDKIRAAGGADAKTLERYRQLNQAYIQASRAAGVYGQSIDQIRAAQERNNGVIAESARQLTRYQNIQSRRQAMRDESARRREVMGSAVGVAASGMAMAAPLKIGLEFEEAMSKVRAISGATGSTFDALQAQARELGASTVWSAKEAAEGMTFLSMAGFNARQTMAAMPGMLSLASAGAMDLGSTADIASNILSGFGFEADKMDYVGDVLAKTFTRSNTTIASLGESMKYCAPTASKAGQSFQDLAAMIGKLGDAGIQGSMAGTGLNAIIGRLSAPPKEAASAMSRLGLKMADANGKMRALPDVFKELADKTANMSEQQIISYANALFGTEHYAKGLVLMAAAGSGALQEMSASLYEEGYATKVAKEQTNNLSGDLKGLNSASEEVSIAIFEAVNPALRSITQKITSLVQSTGAWVRENPRLAQGLFMLGGALTALKAGAIAFTLMRSLSRSAGLGLANFGSRTIGVFSGVRSALGQARKALLIPWNFRAAGAGLSSLRTRLASLRASVVQTTSRMRSLGVAGMAAGAKAIAASAMASASRTGWNLLRGGLRGVGAAFRIALGPVSLLMTALSFGVDYVIENWDKITPYFQSLWDGVKSVFDKVRGWLEPFFGMVGKGMDFVGGLWDRLFGGNDKKDKTETPEKKPDISGFSPELQKAIQREANITPIPTLADSGMNFDEAEIPAQVEETPAKKSANRPKKASFDEVLAKKAGHGQAMAPVTNNVSVSMDFDLNGMPAADFSNGVIRAIREKQADLESIISAIVQNQARLAYGG